MVGQLQFVQEGLAALSRSEWHEVAEESEVPFSTLKKIGYRQTPTPRSDTVDKIAAALRSRKPKRRPSKEARA